MPRHDQIVLQLQKLIAQGKLRSCDKLPPERTLAQTFQVSRNSVREAIKALAVRGVLQSRQGDGTYVLRVAIG